MTLRADELLARLEPSLLARALGGLWKRSGDREVAVHDGDLHVSGAWSPPASPYAVLGNLTVEGSLITAAADRDGGLLVVAGNARCRDLLAAAETTTYIGGALTVDGLLFAATRDVIFELFGPLRARFAITGAGTGWLTSYHDDVTVDGYYDYFADGRTRKPHAAMATQPAVDLRREVVEDLLELEEWACMSDDERAAETAEGMTALDYAGFDEERVHARFYAGEPLLKG